MGKRKKVAYVVLKGHRTGIFDTWEETRLATQGFKKSAECPMGPEFQGYFTREEAERAWREKKLKPDDSPAAAPAPPKKKARVAAPAPAPAIVQPPRGISGDEAALARYPAHEQRLLEARDFFAAIDAHPYEDSDEDGEPPQQMTGYFPPWENEIYLNLLNKYGQPLKENHRAVTAFQLEFNYRVWDSVTAHPNKFNGGQRTHKTGPRGGKIKSTVYRDWVEANGGKWVGFQWKLLDSA